MACPRFNRSVEETGMSIIVFPDSLSNMVIPVVSRKPRASLKVKKANGYVYLFPNP